MAQTTRPVGAALTWEQYCSQVGVDPKAARDATLVRALWSKLRRLDDAMARALDSEQANESTDPPAD